MVILPTLYKKSKNNSIRYWEVSMQLTSTTSEFVVLIKTSGVLGTDKPTVYKDVITEGKNIGKKNETTPAQQAEIQAQSAWTSKKNEGYKTLEDLGIESMCKVQVTSGSEYTVYNYEGEKYTKLEEVLLEAISASTLVNKVKPMLAQEVNWDNVTYPCFIQPKLDGCRSLRLESNTFISTNGKEFLTLDHLKPQLEHINCILDGQIYQPTMSFQDITSALKRLQGTSINLEFHVYDLVSDEDQNVRLNKLKEIFRDNVFSKVKLVPTYEVNNYDEAIKHYINFVLQGYEGAMIRTYDNKYENGRSPNLLKVKSFDTNEFKFLYWEFGKRGVDDLIAVCESDKGTFMCKMKGTGREKEKLYYTRLLGKEITVQHFGYTDKGLPRFPIGLSVKDYE